MTEPISPRRVVVLLIAVALAALGAIFGQPLMHGNETAVTLIVTVFSVLAGLLIGILTLIADPALLSGASWRAAYEGKRVLMQRIHGHRLLFLVYLLTLVLMLVASLLADDYPRSTLFLEYAYLFLATLGFIYSFGLPWTLATLQEERLNRVVREERQKAGLKD